MKTRDKIIVVGDNLIREKGYNAFSFSDISKELKIKNASIHYHFPTKTNLVIAVIQKHLILLEKFKTAVVNENAIMKIIKFLSVYSIAKSGGKISILGSLANDYNTFDPEVQTELKILTESTINWLTQTLTEGKKEGTFKFIQDPRTKALTIITTILGAEQLSRITYPHTFQTVKENILNDLKQEI
ncbi:TetR/AcrR family transcriptional regulator [Zhouia amylolytica]|uniref:Regulatory protein tetr n=1 Tax=Zhouia amylolytica AD3 TaxID=1286632 RepID=W2UNG2_9FLAO|nr:TetR/AcrR family transcriptional regulator [Zhouia amylolytica]ETN95489.1 regulatory protein tetr [Zhouia amylolytica AD3]